MSYVVRVNKTKRQEIFINLRHKTISIQNLEIISLKKNAISLTTGTLWTTRRYWKNFVKGKLRGTLPPNMVDDLENQESLPAFLGGDMKFVLAVLIIGQMGPAPFHNFCMKSAENQGNLFTWLQYSQSPKRFVQKH